MGSLPDTFHLPAIIQSRKFFLSENKFSNAIVLQFAYSAFRLLSKVAQCKWSKTSLIEMNGLKFPWDFLRDTVMQLVENCYLQVTYGGNVSGDWQESQTGIWWWTLCQTIVRLCNVSGRTWLCRQQWRVKYQGPGHHCQLRKSFGSVYYEVYEVDVGVWCNVI